MVTVCKPFVSGSGFCDRCVSSHEIVITARKKAAKYRRQRFTATHRTILVKQIIVSNMPNPEKPAVSDAQE
jgi:hypothetical protein